jgi:hypothetical protein
MHSQHVTYAAQDALDALMRRYPPRPLAITSAEATTDPLPDSNAAQDTTLPDAPTTTAPAEKDVWKTVEGKCDPGHSFCCTEGNSIIRFSFLSKDKARK